MDSMEFTYRHPKTGETKTVALTRAEIEEHMEGQLYDKFAKTICSCEPIGETNVVECNCHEYTDEFELI